MQAEPAAARSSLWRARGMQALVGVTILGFASYCLTLASLPAYAVAGGAAESTAGVVTAVLLLVTIAVQLTVPALTARFGTAAVLAAGLIAMGLPSPFYVLDDSILWISALGVVRGAGFAVLGRDVPVTHLMPDGRLTPHRPSAGAVVGDDGLLHWPAVP